MYMLGVSIDDLTSFKVAGISGSSNKLDLFLMDSGAQNPCNLSTNTSTATSNADGPSAAGCWRLLDDAVGTKENAKPKGI
mmetsp:Transcript_27015/g.47052  ORF Transcript_27015/g.47052 Transcript_27015/m.47052 type:complete len:80 (-) Transcript_27015:87-326(-)